MINQNSNISYIEKFTVNITDQASNNKLDPVIGRDEEIRRTIHILSRRIKNNPVLVGDAGVGKTAIIEGLAQRIATKDVPDTLKAKVILSLDIASCIAGTQMRGEFEARLKGILNAVSDNPNIILFIDEVHMLVGAGAIGAGSMDASNILKPALSRGQVQCIGATTNAEYKKYIEKDSAFERRFQKILINEPDNESTIAILRGLKEKYEMYHGVSIKDDAIVEIVNLTSRYIHNRFMPDKAIDIMDEAASRMNVELNSYPEEIDQMMRDIHMMNMEKQSILSDGSSNNQRAKEIGAKITKLSKELKDSKLKWENEKNLIKQIKFLKKSLDTQKSLLSDSLRGGDYERAAELQYNSIPKLTKQIQDQESFFAKDSSMFLDNLLTVNYVRDTIAKVTGIPMYKLNEDDRSRFQNIKLELSKSIIGQEDAINSISHSLHRSYADFRDKSKPIGTFLFTGPSGVGKTETAKVLANLLFNSSSNMIRLDMSEYMEKHSIAKLIGSPPGYIGYEESGLLCDRVRRSPWQLILLDEIEKAHVDVLNILLQIMDDGRLSDSHGNYVDFSNTIIIMTSNLITNVEDDYSTQRLMKDLTKHLKPEFINRIDDIIVFNSLSIRDIEQILNIHLNKITNKLAERRIALNITPQALSLMAKNAYSYDFGARSLIRYVQSNIQNIIASYIVESKLIDGNSISIHVKNDKLIYEIN